MNKTIISLVILAIVLVSGAILLQPKTGSAISPFQYQCVSSVSATRNIALKTANDVYTAAIRKAQADRDVAFQSANSAYNSAVTACQNQPDPKLACTNSGGILGTTQCCNSASNFPNTCNVGACGCALAYSHNITVCNCGAGRCFNGTSCVPLN